MPNNIWCGSNLFIDLLHSHFESFYSKIMTATVETVAEQLDLAAIMPAEKVVAAVARSVTLSDADVGKKRPI